MDETMMQFALFGILLPSTLIGCALGIGLLIRCHPVRFGFIGKVLPFGRQTLEEHDAGPVGRGYWEIPLLFALGYHSGHIVVEGAPNLAQPLNPLHLFAAAIGVVGLANLFESAVGFPWWLRSIRRAATAGALPVLLLWPLNEVVWKDEKLALWAAGLGMTGVLVVLLGEWIAERQPGFFLPLCVVIAFTALSLNMIQAAHYAKLGQLVGTVTSMAGAAMVAGVIWPRVSHAKGLLEMLLFSGLGLLTLARFYGDQDATIGMYLLPWAAPLVLILREAPLLKSRPFWVQALIVLLLLFLLAGAGLAWAKFGMPTPEEYSYEY